MRRACSANGMSFKKRVPKAHRAAGLAVRREAGLELAQEGRLAAAALAAEDRDRALGDREREIVERRARLPRIGKCQMFERKRRHVSASFPSSSSGKKAQQRKARRAHRAERAGAADVYRRVIAHIQRAAADAHAHARKRERKHGAEQAVAPGEAVVAEIRSSAGAVAPALHGVRRRDAALERPRDGDGQHTRAAAQPLPRTALTRAAAERRLCRSDGAHMRSELRHEAQRHAQQQGHARQHAAEHVQIFIRRHDGVAALKPQNHGREHRRRSRSVAQGPRA